MRRSLVISGSLTLTFLVTSHNPLCVDDKVRIVRKMATHMRLFQGSLRNLVYVQMRRSSDQLGELGKGAGKGGGGGGSVREAGGAFGKRQAAEEERYFRQKEQEQLSALKKHHEEEIHHAKEQIERLQKEIDRHKNKIKKLKNDD
ncbi:ATPase inhibitor, mitochondrial [Hyla sarda]|uniref:ATPase inhibitor, mitochondrial n=1 Tax=Hyla sarda TaxID=327740 RepID=UPI0024C3AC0D|nr:ATPase inhibitor, mitochondrial [Hyla sarda]